LTKWMCSCAKYLRRMKMKTYTFVWDSFYFPE
jgi:hypothetical protein